MSLDHYLEENIFRPLGMKDTSFVISDDKAHRLASIYKPSLKDNTKLVGLTRGEIYCEYDPRKCRYFSGGAGLLSTLKDYVKFTKMLLHKGYCKQTDKQIIS